MACRHLLLPAGTLVVDRDVLDRGEGTFEEPLKLRSENPPTAIATGDFDGGGKLDLAFVNGGDRKIRFFFQDPSDRKTWRLRPALCGEGPAEDRLGICGENCR